MNKLLMIVTAFILTLSSISYAQEEVKKDTKSTETIQKDSKVFNTICPVSSEEADPEITHVVDGVKYAVCCKSCLKKFKADPQKYISKLSEDGKSLKKKNNQ